MSIWFKRLLNQDSFDVLSCFYIFVILSTGLYLMGIALMLYRKSQKQKYVSKIGIRQHTDIVLQKILYSISLNKEYYAELEQECERDAKEYETYLHHD